MPGEQLLDGVAAERPAATGAEQRVGAGAAALGDPGGEHGDGLGGERGAAFLAAFPAAVHVRPGAEAGVGDGEAGELGDPQPGLACQDQQRVVAAGVPGGGAGRGQQRLGLVAGEEGHGVLVVPFGGDGQHPGDQR